MKKLLLILLCLPMISCIDGPEIIPCFVGIPLTDTVCAEIYEPVCGCNDITYDNECYAEKNGISSWIEGVCID